MTATQKSKVACDNVQSSPITIVTSADKVEIMEEKYKIPMERKIKKELNQMCNLSDYVEEIGIKKGLSVEKFYSKSRLFKRDFKRENRCRKSLKGWERKKMQSHIFMIV